MSDYHIFYKEETVSIGVILMKRFDIEKEKDPFREVFVKYSKKTFFDELDDLVQEYFNEKDWDDIYHYFLYNMIKRKKKKWKDKAIRDFKSKKLKRPKELHRLYEEYKRIPNVDEDDKIKARMYDLSEWEQDNKAKLSDYPFFEEKTLSAIRYALRDDLALLFLDYIKDKIENKQPLSKKEIKEYPYDNQLVYANHTHRKPIEFDGYIDHNSEKKPYKEIGPKEGALRLLLESNESADLLADAFNIEKDVYDLDQTDRDILSTVMEYRDKNFATDKTIHLTLGELLSDVFESRGAKNATYLLRRIYKLQRLRFYHVSYDKNKGNSSKDYLTNLELMGFFDYVKFSERNNGEIYLTIEINKGIYSRFINNQTLRIYKDQLKLIDPKYHSLLLYMQKERIRAYRSNVNVAELTMKEFVSNIRFSAKSKRKVREEIKEGLDEIIKSQALVTRYTHGQELFRIEFDPIKEEEVQDIIGEKKRKIDIHQLLPKNEKPPVTRNHIEKS